MWRHFSGEGLAPNQTRLRIGANQTCQPDYSQTTLTYSVAGVEVISITPIAIIHASLGVSHTLVFTFSTVQYLVMAATAFITSGQEVHQAVVPGLLRLPQEILEMVTLQLHPREAILLSLTCRTLHHGFLSEANSYLWFRLGGFRESRLPGWSQKWLDPSYSMLQRRSSSKAFKIMDIMKKYAYEQKEANVLNTFNKLAPIASRQQHAPPTTAGAVQVLRGDNKFRRGFLWFTINYRYLEGERSPYVVNYKKLLVESMFGRTDDGCQWCLARPLRAKYYEGLKLRLCTECFGRDYMRSVPSLCSE